MRTLLVIVFGLAVALAFAPHKDYERKPEIHPTYIVQPKGLTSHKHQGTPVAIAQSYITSKYPNTKWEVTDSYKTKHNAVDHVYLRQVVKGVPVANALANVNIRDGDVLSMGATPFTGPHPRSLPTTLDDRHLTPEQAFVALLKYLDVPQLATKMAVPETDISFVMTEDQVLSLTYKMVVHFNTDVYESYVDAENGEVLGCYDWVKHDDDPVNAVYSVYDYPDTDPGRGPRVDAINPWERFDAMTSPEGYHDQGNGNEFHVTIGNNVYAQENHDGSSSWEFNYRPDGGSPPTYDFIFPIDFGQHPHEYQDAAISNLFYWNNLIHDLFYERGFDEVSGNFQENNWGRGGQQGDAVQANAQDGAGYNNANFYTPPDGQRPRMRMYLWRTATPFLDGDLDSGIITHEYGHGISNRLTGGPNIVNCLSGGQAGGMGEGWSDWWAVMLETQASDTINDIFPMGSYATGNPAGIRYFPYAYNTNVNPQTFAFISQSGYSGVHAKGSVWCTILFNVYWEMRMAFGYSPDWINGDAGNNKLWQNVVDGLKLQPCNPNFVQARDAILQADEVNYNGVHKCTMWKGFARRGLGVGAIATTTPVREDFNVPNECM